MKFEKNHSYLVRHSKGNAAIGFLLHCGLALQTVHHLHGAVTLAPIDAVCHQAALSGISHSGGHEANVGPHHAVVHGQTGSDAFYALADRHLDATDISAAGVTLEVKERQTITNVTLLVAGGWVKRRRTICLSGQIGYKTYSGSR